MDNNKECLDEIRRKIVEFKSKRIYVDERRLRLLMPYKMYEKILSECTLWKRNGHNGYIEKIFGITVVPMDIDTVVVTAVYEFHEPQTHDSKELFEIRFLNCPCRNCVENPFLCDESNCKQLDNWNKLCKYEDSLKEEIECLKNHIRTLTEYNNCLRSNQEIKKSTKIDGDDLLLQAIKNGDPITEEIIQSPYGLRDVMGGG